MRVAALFDIHGNLPALDAVLEDVRRAGADRIVVGGDVVPGPMPRECLERLLGLDHPVQFIHGNCELTALALMAAGESGTVTYWGTVTGNPLPEPDQQAMRWTVSQLGPEHERRFASWPKTLRLAVDGVGDVVFCHSTPRSETEVFLRTTAVERLVPLFDPLGASLAVVGHTHMQFDRQVGRTRVVNAGSVGMPFGEAGAFWALLGPEVQLRRTEYDLVNAAERIRATQHPQAEKFANDLRQPPSERQILELFGQYELK
jgi:predicted phosphodiesterase